VSYFLLAMCDKTTPDVVAALQEAVQDELGFELHPNAWPLDWSPAWDPARSQYNSSLALRALLEKGAAGARRVLALTERDLFIPMLSFVYGQAQLGGTFALVSLARLRQEFSGLPPNPALFLARARTEALHELGHTFGLTHCPTPACAMALATNLRQLDLKKDTFCDSCRVLLRERRNMDEIPLANPGR